MTWAVLGMASSSGEQTKLQVASEGVQAKNVVAMARGADDTLLEAQFNPKPKPTRLPQAHPDNDGPFGSTQVTRGLMMCWPGAQNNPKGWL